MDRGARRATIHRVTKSRPRLKQLSTNGCSIVTDIQYTLYKHSYLEKLTEKNLDATYKYLLSTS